MLLGQCCRRSRFDADHPRLGFSPELYNVLGGLISGVGDVNGHAQLVHSANNLSSEVC